MDYRQLMVFDSFDLLIILSSFQSFDTEISQILNTYTIVMIPKLDPESKTNCDTSETKRVHLSGLESALLSVNLRASHQNVMFPKQVSSDVMRR